MTMKKQSLLGNQYGRYTVTSEAPPRGGRSFWICQCSCGVKREVEHSNLKRGISKSCGCLRIDAARETIKGRFVTHGDSSTHLYLTYQGMRKRCYTPRSSAYKAYGAKGIKVSPLWDTYESFKEWSLINGYNDSLTLDREDSAEDYGPNNCRWATYETQLRNRRKNKRPTSSTFIGVSWNQQQNKWVAYVTVSKKTVSLGYFDDELLAAKTRDHYITSHSLKDFKMNF